MRGNTEPLNDDLFRRIYPSPDTPQRCSLLLLAPVSIVGFSLHPLPGNAAVPAPASYSRPTTRSRFSRSTWTSSGGPPLSPFRGGEESEPGWGWITWDASSPGSAQKSPAGEIRRGVADKVWLITACPLAKSFTGAGSRPRLATAFSGTFTPPMPCRRTLALFSCTQPRCPAQSLSRRLLFPIDLSVSRSVAFSDCPPSFRRPPDPGVVARLGTASDDVLRSVSPGHISEMCRLRSPSPACRRLVLGLVVALGLRCVAGINLHEFLLGGGWAVGSGWVVPEVRRVCCCCCCCCSWFSWGRGC